MNDNIGVNMTFEGFGVPDEVLDAHEEQVDPEGNVDSNGKRKKTSQKKGTGKKTREAEEARKAKEDPRVQEVLRQHEQLKETKTYLKLETDPAKIKRDLDRLDVVRKAGGLVDSLPKSAKAEATNFGPANETTMEVTTSPTGITDAEHINQAQEQAAIDLAAELFAASKPVEEEKPAETRKSGTIRFKAQRDINRPDINLPPVTLEYLANGAPEGSRNDALMHAACQVRDAGLLDHMEEQLIERAVSDGLRESEARATIRSVRSREAREPITGADRQAYPTGGNGGNLSPNPKPEVQQYEPTGETEALPTDLVATTPIQFLTHLYKTGDLLCLTFPDNDGTPRNELCFVTLDGADEYPEELRQRCESGKGVWFVVNPLNSESRTDANVADFRYLLVELDNGPKETQFANLKKSGLPFAAIYDSGNKSIHGLVKVDAVNIEEFRERQKIVYSYLSKLGIDDKNKNPARLSRLPGCKRGDKWQQLYTWDVGARSWGEWENSQDSTEWFGNNRLRDFDRKDDPSSLLGNRWLCRGGSLVIQGYTGIGKSSFALQMALHWAVGKEFFGIPTKRPLRTIFLQAENDLGDFAEAFQDITSSFSEDENALVDRNFMSGREATVCGAEAFSAKIRKMVGDFRPDIIFCDPLLSYFGNDISKQEQASKFFRRYLQPIQNETGIIIVFVHHLGKPLQNGQRQGPNHYQGLGSSDIINWTRETIMLTQEGNTFVMELGKRAKRAGFREKFLRHSDSGVRWEEANGIETREDAKMRVETRRRENLRGFVFHHGIVTLTQMKDKASHFGYTQNTIKTALDAIAQNEVGCDEPIYCFEAHVNGSRYVQTVYSTRTKPADGYVESKDLDLSMGGIVRLNGKK